MEDKALDKKRRWAKRGSAGRSVSSARGNLSRRSTKGCTSFDLLASRPGSFDRRLFHGLRVWTGSSIILYTVSPFRDYYPTQHHCPSATCTFDRQAEEEALRIIYVLDVFLSELCLPGPRAYQACAALPSQALWTKRDIRNSNIRNEDIIVWTIFSLLLSTISPYPGIRRRRR